MIQIAREQGMPYWSAVASTTIGRLLVDEGSPDAGIAQMRDAMAILLETGGELVYNHARCLLAEGYLRGREPERGLTALEAVREPIN